MMRFFSFKNFFKIFIFLSLLGGFTYFIVSKIQYRYNIMSFEDYSPISSLVTDVNNPRKAKFPFVDIHNHQFDMPLKNLADLVTEMDSLNTVSYTHLTLPTKVSV